MSKLATMNPRFQSQIVTPAQLAALPAPVALGRWHKPVPHIELVECVRTEAAQRGLIVNREKYALSQNHQALFAVLDFADMTEDGERAVSLGFRNSTDQTLSIQGVAGAHVFVCDNLCLAGDFEAWSRKNTSGVRLADLVKTGFEVFHKQSERFEADVRRLQSTAVADYTAKTMMWDVFADGVLPARFLGEANENYFSPTPEMTDCAPRTAWGVHNALTRVARRLAPQSLADATTELGRRFRIGVS